MAPSPVPAPGRPAGHPNTHPSGAVSGHTNGAGIALPRATRPAELPSVHGALLCVALPAFAVCSEHGQLTGEGPEGVYDAGRRLLSRCVLRVAGREPVALQGRMAAADRAVFLGALRVPGDTGPDPALTVERTRSADGTERITLRSAAARPLRLPVEVALGTDLADLGAVASGRTGPELAASVHGTGLRWTGGDGRSVAVTADPPPMDSLAAAGVLRWEAELAPGAAFTLRLRVRGESAARPAASSGAGTGRPGGHLLSEARAEETTHARRNCSAPPSTTCGPCSSATLPTPPTSTSRPESPGAADRSPPKRSGRPGWPCPSAPGSPPPPCAPSGAPNSPAVDPRPAASRGPSGTRARTSRPAARASRPPSPFRPCSPRPAAGGSRPRTWRSCFPWRSAASTGSGVRPAGTGSCRTRAPPGPGGPRPRRTRTARPCSVPTSSTAAGGPGETPCAKRPGSCASGSGASSGSTTRREAAAVARAPDGRTWSQLGGWAAHLLDTGLVGGGRYAPGLLGRAEAEQVARLLGTPALDSGWGLRGLGTKEPGHNPFGHRAGAVRVHETAVAVAGLAAAGHEKEAASLLRGLLDAAEAFTHRLPEMYAGEQRTTGGRPVPHPAACRPAAVAAAGAVHALLALAGIRPDVPGRSVSVQPPASAPLGAIRLSGLVVAGEPFAVRVGRLGLGMVEEAAQGLQLGV